jgi:hypothetical protein
MEYFTSEQQVVLIEIYSRVLEKNLNEEQLEQLFCDEITIIFLEYKKGRDYFKTLVQFWNNYLNNEPFIYFP